MEDVNKQYIIIFQLQYPATEEEDVKGKEADNNYRWWLDP